MLTFDCWLEGGQFGPSYDKFCPTLKSFVCGDALLSRGSPAIKEAAEQQTQMLSVCGLPVARRTLGGPFADYTLWPGNRFEKIDPVPTA